jgi:hypothetical protein
MLCNARWSNWSLASAANAAPAADRLPKYRLFVGAMQSNVQDNHQLLPWPSVSPSIWVNSEATRKATLVQLVTKRMNKTLEEDADKLLISEHD